MREPRSPEPAFNALIAGAAAAMSPAVPPIVTTPMAVGMWFNWLTSSDDDVEHAVSDEQVALCFRTGHGIYVTMCGHAVTPGALVAPPGKRCPGCVARIDPARYLVRGRRGRRLRAEPLLSVRRGAK